MPPLRDARSPEPSLVWLHGFTQTGRSAREFRSILTAHRKVLSPDLARHGTRALFGGDLDAVARDVAERLPDEPCDLGGYSFGARVALHLALAQPERVRRLVVIGATRGIEDPLARQRRRERDEVLAQHIEEIGAEAFIDEWMAQPMFATLPDDPDERAARVGQDASSLAASLREAGTGTQRWLGDEMASITSATLAIAGARDDRFAREAAAIATGTGGSFALIPGAGHAAHIEQPGWCAGIVESFLSSPVHE